MGEAGLNELRFNLGASGCADKVIENIGIAKKYIKKVGIETPMTNEFFEKFFLKKQAVLDTGLDFINCAELHLNPNNIENYGVKKCILPAMDIYHNLESRTDTQIYGSRSKREMEFGCT